MVVYDYGYCSYCSNLEVDMVGMVDVVDTDSEVGMLVDDGTNVVGVGV